MRGSAAHFRRRRLTYPTATPKTISPPMMARKTRRAEPSENMPVATAATANLYSMSAVASLARPSPSRTTMVRRGSPSRRAMAIGATSSGGEMMAPSTKATAQSQARRKWTTAATATVVKATPPTASRLIERIL